MSRIQEKQNKNIKQQKIKQEVSNKEWKSMKQKNNREKSVKSKAHFFLIFQNITLYVYCVEIY